jgi:hypothetical protein
LLGIQGSGRKHFQQRQQQPERKTTTFLPKTSAATSTKIQGCTPKSQSLPRQVSLLLCIDFFFTMMIIAETPQGAGIMVMPYTVKSLGYLATIGAFIIFFALNQFSSVLLLKSKNLAKHSNYSTLLYYVLGKNWARIFASAVIFVHNLLACTPLYR